MNAFLISIKKLQLKMDVFCVSCRWSYGEFCVGFSGKYNTIIVFSQHENNNNNIP